MWHPVTRVGIEIETIVALSWNQHTGDREFPELPELWSILQEVVDRITTRRGESLAKFAKLREPITHALEVITKRRFVSGEFPRDAISECGSEWETVWRARAGTEHENGGPSDH